MPTPEAPSAIPSSMPSSVPSSPAIWPRSFTPQAPPANPRASLSPTATSPPTRITPQSISTSIPPTPASPSFRSLMSPLAPSITSCIALARRWPTARNSTSCRRPCATSGRPSSSACHASLRRFARRSSTAPPDRRSSGVCSPGPSAWARASPIPSTTAAGPIRSCGSWPTSWSIPRFARPSADASGSSFPAARPLGSIPRDGSPQWALRFGRATVSPKPRR